MSKDLMELVDGCPVKTDVLETKGMVRLRQRREEIISEYRELGFKKGTEEVYQEHLETSKRQRIYEFEYRVINTKAIRKFLQR